MIYWKKKAGAILLCMTILISNQNLLTSFAAEAAGYELEEDAENTAEVVQTGNDTEETGETAETTAIPQEAEAPGDTAEDDSETEEAGEAEETGEIMETTADSGPEDMSEAAVLTEVPVESFGNADEVVEPYETEAIADRDLGGGISVETTLTAELAEGVKVEAHIPAGTFETSVELKVQIPDMNSEEAGQTMDAVVKNAETAVAGAYVADISFQDAGGNEVEPKGPVRITVSSDPVDIYIPKEADIASGDCQVYHVTEGEAEKLPSGEVLLDEENRFVGMSFESDVFSPFAAVVLDKPEELGNGNVCEIPGKTEYGTLEAAFTAADAGDTIRLLEDTELTAALEAGKNVILDLNEKKITVAAEVTGSAFAVSDSFTVKNGTIQAAEGMTDCRAICADANGAAKTCLLEAVTIQGFNLTDGDGAGVYTKDYNLTVKNCNIKNNICPGGGGGIYASKGAVQITGCVFDGNECQLYGGAISCWQNPSVEITSNTIQNCQTTESDYSWGGGICIALFGYDSAGSGNAAVLTGNTIKNNTSHYAGGGLFMINPYGNALIEGNTIQDNEAVLHGNGSGGGIALVETPEYTHEGQQYHELLQNNTISGNFATYAGGGIYNGNGANTLVDIPSGLMENNSTDGMGGGIGAPGENTVVALKNVIITGNKALSGGAIYTCSTANLGIHTTLGGAIYNNEAAQAYKPAGSFWSDDSHGNAIYYQSTVNPATVSPRALGGGLIDWYADEADSRYQPGDATVDVIKDYTNKTGMFNLHSELDEQGIRLAESVEPKLIIRNNTADLGGAIGANGTVIIGEDQDISVTVEKLWKDADGNLPTTHPQSVEVTLIRVNKNDSGDTAELETVTLSQDNGWKHTFNGLPGNYTYTVQEKAVDGYKAEYGALQQTGDRTYSITLTNSVNAAGSLSVSKKVEGTAGDKTKEFTFTVTLGDKSVNGVYGEMTFTEGVAVFTLKDGQTKTASDLPAGTAYEVAEKEEGQDGYTTVKTGASGTIGKDKTAAAVFTNTKNEEAKPLTGNLSVSKKVEGTAGDKTKEFTFTVTLGDKSVNGVYGEMTFTEGAAVFTLKDGQTKTAVGLPAGTAYEVAEKEEGQDGYTTVKTGASGIIERDKTAAAVFTNTKNETKDTNEAEETEETEETEDADGTSSGAGGKSPSNGTTPATGDNSPLLWLALVCAVSFMLIVMMLLLKKTRSK